MLKIFTVKFEEKIESFNDSIITNFLSDKVIIKWEGNHSYRNFSWKNVKNRGRRLENG